MQMVFGRIVHVYQNTTMEATSILEVQGLRRFNEIIFLNQIFSLLLGKGEISNGSRKESKKIYKLL